jgi:uncharacterized membrane protein
MEIMMLLLCSAIVALIVLSGKIKEHSKRMKNLELRLTKLNPLMREVDELREQIKRLGIPGSPRKEETVEPQKTAPPVFTPLPIGTLTPPVISQKKPSRTREEWESFVGGKLMNRIGALALIIGIGLFLKYAFDNNWINETARVLISGAIGLACVVGAYTTNKRGFQVFAQGLVGAGISIIYLSVYASFNFYHLVPQWVAFGMMFLITAFTFANGLFYDSLAVAVLGWAGGFLTPILLSTGVANEIGLFGYIMLLDAGLATLIVLKKHWYILEPLTLAGTWLMFLAWHQDFYTEQDLGITGFFITLFWGIFLFLDIIRSRDSASRDTVSQIVPGLNALFYYTALYFMMNKEHHVWMGAVTIGVGAVYLVMLLLLHRRGGLTEVSRIRYTLTAVALLILATSIEFEDFNMVMFWSIEAAGLLWCAWYWKLEYVEQAGLTLFGLSALKLLFFTKGAYSYIPLQEFSLMLNTRSAAFAVLAGSLLLSASTINERKEDKQQRISAGLHYAWILMVFALLTIETNDYIRYRALNRAENEKALLDFVRLMAFGVVWIVYSLPLVSVGLWKKNSPLLVSGLALGSIAVIFAAVRGIAFEPIEQFSFILNIRFLALAIITAGLVILAKILQKWKETSDWLNDAIGIVQFAIMLVVFILLTSETRDYFQKGIDALVGQNGPAAAERSHLANLQQLSLSGAWLLYSAVLMSLGIWRRFRGIRFAAIGIFGITILKIFVYDLSFLETLYRIFSFIALGVILLAVSYAYQKYKNIIVAKE